MSLVEIGTTTQHLNSSGTRILKYSIEIRHKGLNEYKYITAPELSILQSKVSSQIEKWEDKWDKIEKKNEKLDEQRALIEEAKRKTAEAQQLLNNLNNLLIHSKKVVNALDWESLMEKEPYQIHKPYISTPKSSVKFWEIEPNRNDYIVKLNLFDRIFRKFGDNKKQKSEELFMQAHEIWINKKTENEQLNLKIKEENDLATLEWEKSCKIWEDNQNQYYRNQEKHNQSIKLFKEKYLNHDKKAIEKYCSLVLRNSQYPDFFPQSYAIDYLEESKILIVEYDLPPKSEIPTIKEVKYIKVRNELKESHISEAQINSLFDEIMYKISLRTLYELFDADKIGAIESIAFNGWVKSINMGTGKEVNSCILSMLVAKEEFLEIELEYVNPKICFKELKGIGSSKLSGIIPVKPIMRMNKTDKRFVDSYNVSQGIDSSTNLAAMNWEDFEHLVRELFQEEFSVNGGEVKVTQASRDGGVDAIAFDPDPIRGGKIVIQAKRYTNTVGVSAVRDLYGTVLNEGATKGILVSTASFGPDAYNFAKDKPLTLLNGGNLLHLLQKHGHKAKIDIKEAKLILAEERD